MIVRLAEIPIEGGFYRCMDRALAAAEAKPVPDLLILPELFTVGFNAGEIEKNAITVSELEELPLALAAGENGIWIAGGTFPVKTHRGTVNMLPVFDRKGRLVHTTEKTHLFENMGEKSMFTPGMPSGVFDLDGVTTGASVCYDLRFPELFRRLALMGAELILVPAQWPEARQDLFRSFLRARAGEAQIFLAGCNLGGEHLGERFNGGGAVAHPSGDLLDGIPVDEHTKDYGLNMNDVSGVRSIIDCLSDRRPEAYGGSE